MHVQFGDPGEPLPATFPSRTGRQFFRLEASISCRWLTRRSFFPSSIHIGFSTCYLPSSIQDIAMHALLTAVLAAAVSANRLAERQVSGTSTVNLSNNTGSISHRASGFIYGIPDTPDQIPDSFYSDMGFNYARAGGAQVPAPGRGWIWGLTEYKVRSYFKP